MELGSFGDVMHLSSCKRKRKGCVDILCVSVGTAVELQNPLW